MHIGRLNVQTAGSLPLIAGSVLLVAGLVAVIVILIGLSGVITLNRGFMIMVSYLCNNINALLNHDQYKMHVLCLLMLVTKSCCFSLTVHHHCGICDSLPSSGNYTRICIFW